MKEQSVQIYEKSYKLILRIKMNMTDFSEYINSASISLQELQIDKDNKRIYILDKNSGIHVFNIDFENKNITIKHSSFVIPIENGISFDFILNTFIVVAEIN